MWWLGPRVKDWDSHQLLVGKSRSSTPPGFNSNKLSEECELSTRRIRVRGVRGGTGRTLIGGLRGLSMGRKLRGGGFGLGW